MDPVRVRKLLAGIIVRPQRRLYFTFVPDEQDTKSVVVLTSPVKEKPLSTVLKLPTEGFKPFSEKLTAIPSDPFPLFVTFTNLVM